MADDSLYDSLASELEASDSGYSFSYKSQLPADISPIRASSQCGDRQVVKTQSLENEKEQVAIEQAALELKEHYAIEDQLANENEDAVFDPILSDTGASERAKGIMRSIEAALAMPHYSKGASLK